jgi:hypothetical protein
VEGVEGVEGIFEILPKTLKKNENIFFFFSFNFEKKQGTPPPFHPYPPPIFLEDSKIFFKQLFQS